MAAGRRWAFAGRSFAKTTVFVTFCLQKVRQIIFKLLLDVGCRVTEVVLISIRTNVKCAGAVAGRGSGPAVGFCGGKLCQDLDFWFFWAKPKEQNIVRFSPDVVNKYLRFYPYFNESVSLALELS